MRIATIPNAPDGGHRLIISALRDILPHADTSGGREATPALEIEISQPIPIYRLGLNRLHRRMSAQAADQVGWRYVVKMDFDKFGVADLNDLDGEGVRFSSFSSTSISHLFLQALHVAQDVVRKSSDKCEIRCLDVPSLYASALWITSRPPAFVPYLAPSSISTEIMSVDFALVEKLAALAKTEMTQSPR